MTINKASNVKMKEDLCSSQLSTSVERKFIQSWVSLRTKKKLKNSEALKNKEDVYNLGYQWYGLFGWIRKRGKRKTYALLQKMEIK